MKLTKKQTDELQKNGYDPCVKYLNLYPEDFMMDLKIWDQVLQCLDLDCADQGLILAIAGVKKEKKQGIK